MLEHVRDPIATLTEVYRITKASAILRIKVPNNRSLVSKFFKHNWAGYDLPRHLYHFDRRSLKTLLELTGWTPQLFKTTLTSSDINRSLRNLFNELASLRCFAKYTNVDNIVLRGGLFPIVFFLNIFDLKCFISKHKIYKKLYKIDFITSLRHYIKIK